MTKFLHKLFLGLTLAATGFSVVPSAAEATPGQSQPHTRTYSVYYRCCPQSPWQFYYTFRNLGDAQRYSNWIRASYHFETFIR